MLVVSKVILATSSLAIKSLTSGTQNDLAPTIVLGNLTLDDNSGSCWDAARDRTKVGNPHLDFRRASYEI